MLRDSLRLHSHPTPEVLMRLSRQKAFLLVLIASIACHSTTGPETISAFFTLQTIDGRALPTYLAATPGPSATIISSSLALYTTGKAVMIEHRNEMLRGGVTDTTAYDLQYSREPIGNTLAFTLPRHRALPLDPSRHDFPLRSEPYHQSAVR